MDSRHSLAFLVGAALAGPGFAQQQGAATVEEIGPVIVTRGTLRFDRRHRPPPSRTSRSSKCRSRSASSRAT